MGGGVTYLLKAVQRDIESSRAEYLRLKERIQKELEDMSDADKAQFLRSELSLVNQRLGTLEGWSAAYLQRCAQTHTNTQRSNSQPDKESSTCHEATQPNIDNFLGRKWCC